MARAPAAGQLRLPVLFGKMESVFDEATGGVNRSFVEEGMFWARRVGVGAADGADLAQSLDGVDISDDLTKLRTWAGHSITSQNYFKIDGQLYSVLSVSPSNDDRMVEYLVVSGLRDSTG